MDYQCPVCMNVWSETQYEEELAKIVDNSYGWCPYCLCDAGVAPVDEGGLTSPSQYV